MQTFTVKVTGNKLEAKEIEQAIYVWFTEMKREDVIVTEI